MATNVKKFRYSILCKALCAVLAVLLSALLAAGASFAVLGLSYPFSETEEEFFNSERVVDALCDRLVNLAIAVVDEEDNSAIYNELLAYEDTVVDTVMEDYKLAKKDYNLYYNSSNYDDDEENEYSENVTRVNSNSYFESLEFTQEVPTTRGDYTFCLSFLEALYSEEGATAQQVLHNAYRDFAYASAYGTAADYYGGFSSTVSMTHSVYKNETAAEVDNSGVLLDEEEQRAAIDFYDNGNYDYNEELQAAHENGYYFIWNDGSVEYDKAVFNEDTAARLTKSADDSFKGHKGITYILRLNYSELLRCADNGHYNLGMLVSGDNIVNYWMLEQANWNSDLVHFLTSDNDGVAVLLGLTLLLTVVLAALYLTVTGRKEKGGAAKLCFKDYIPIELHFIIDLVLGSIPLDLFTDGYNASTVYSVYTPIGAAVSTLFISLVLLDFIASVVRAVKSERKTSSFFLIVLIGRGAAKVFKALKKALSYKPKCFKRNVIIILVLYVIINSFFISIAVNCLNNDLNVIALFFYLLWAGLNITAIYFAADYAKKLDEVIISCVNSTDVPDIDKLYMSLQYLAGSNKYKNVELQRAVEQAVKDERLRSELITNVSHDLKTPLTSITTYVDLLSKCDIDDENAKKYISIIDEKGKRLTRLIDDLIEASKVTSGVITINLTRLNLCELCVQSTGEAQYGFEENGLELIVKEPQENVEIIADGAKNFRVIENLLSNARKYSAENSRVYVSVYKENGCGVFEIKNISKLPLDIDPEELTQRFVRGDKSRSEEGNGLGLSIAKELCRAQNGKLEIIIDGDLFKARVLLPLAE